MRRLNPAAQPRPSQRRRQRPTRQQKALRYGAMAVAGLALGAAGWLAWPGDWIAQQSDKLGRDIIAWSGEAGLTLTRVSVFGRAETPREDLLAALGAAEGDPLLAIDPQALRQKLEDLPWIKSAEVERGWDGHLKLTLTEFQPFALWQRDGRVLLVDRMGEAIPVEDTDRFADLLLLVGNDAPAHATDLLTMMASEPTLQARVRAAVWVGDRRWNLRLDNGVDVKLPEQNPAAAWAELARLEREQGLLQRDLLAIDLRLPDRLVVKLGPTTAARRLDPGSDT